MFRRNQTARYYTSDNQPRPNYYQPRVNYYTDSYRAFQDAPQQTLNFLVSQLTYIEPEVYRVRYPDLQYQDLVPVDSSANEWVRSITFFSIDHAGKAAWFSHLARDIPVADVTRSKFEQTVDMGAIGYRYSTEELAVGAQTPGFQLSNERAMAAKRAAEEFIDDVALRGDADKRWTGLINRTDVTAVDPAADGTGSSPYWVDKDSTKIMRDFNSNLTGMFLSSLTIDLADTVLLPWTALTYLSEQQMPYLPMTILDWIQTRNLYTFQTGRPLMIRGVRGLENAGAGGTGRMICYRRDPQVLKLHLPMPHRFLNVWQEGPMVFAVPGVFRTGGLEIRRPTAFRYMDHVTPAP